MADAPEREPKMVCPACMFVPEIDRPVPGATPPEAHRQAIPKQERWLEYIAHLLEHGVSKEAGGTASSQGGY